MANEFLNTKLIARNALPHLVENLVMPNLCYNDYSNDFAMQGDTIRVRKPVILEAKEFTAGSAVTAQDIKETSVDVTLNKLATVDVNIEAIQAATNVDDLNRLVIEPAAIALAEKINGDGLDMYKYIANTAGTAGTTPDGLDDLAAARKALNIAKVPMTDRFGIWDPAADAKYTEIGNLVKANENGGDIKALREGQIGRVFGMDNYMAQGVKTHTTGATGTVLIDNAAGYAKGDINIHVDGLTAAAKVGDRFTLPNDTTVYVVVAAGDLETTDQDLTIYPGLAAAVTDNKALTFKASYTANLVLHKNAVAFVTRPLVAPAGVDSYTTSYNGLSLRVVRGYDMDYKREKISIDVLYGYKAVYPEMGLVYMG